LRRAQRESVQRFTTGGQVLAQSSILLVHMFAKGKQIRLGD
jgi:hypothetical protein